MERLTKMERTGLLVFAVVLIVMLAVYGFVRQSGRFAGVNPLTEEERMRMERFEAQVKAMKADTVVKEKIRKETDAHSVDIDPLDDKLDAVDR